MCVYIYIYTSVLLCISMHRESGSDSGGSYREVDLVQSLHHNFCHNFHHKFDHNRGLGVQGKLSRRTWHYPKRKGGRREGVREEVVRWICKSTCTEDQRGNHEGTRTSEIPSCEVDLREERGKKHFDPART